jgi:hypothetical protein
MDVSPMPITFAIRTGMGEPPCYEKAVTFAL